MQENSFSGKLGYVLATAGSAVGLGNIWRFPYLAAKYGGGIFLLVYLVLTVVFGFALLVAETAIGRKTGKSSIDAFGDLSARYRWMGILPSLVPILILPYYSVVGGWVINYFVGFCGGSAQAMAQNGYFAAFVGQDIRPITCFVLFVIATCIIVLLGVDRGIEKMSKILMPALIILSLILAIYSITLPGASEGVKYFLFPDFSNFKAKTVLAAMGQMFYSLSISMGILITYGSYMKREVALDDAVIQVEVFDTGVALLSGLMIIPAVFVFSGGDPSAMQAGASLMFVTLPKVFVNLGGFGLFMGTLFFLLVLFAALTSSIALLEAIVSIMTDRFGFSRRKSCLIATAYTLVLGIITSLGFGPLSFLKIFHLSLFDFFDFITNSVMMPIAALGTCYFIARVIKTKTIADEVKISSPFKGEKLFSASISFIAPVCIVLILVSAILERIGVLSL
ncbi:MAG: sodium-dependent transporter [Spirochaetia bacterium]|nr:sodium-dependent transporter [Spirochaetia bacterium]